MAQDNSLDAARKLNNDDEEDEQVLDRGWAWMVVLASLVINIIYDGCSYSFGILFTNLLDYFGDSKSKTAWIGSLFFSVPLLCGPIAGIIADKIGYRNSTILGGVIASVGFTVGAFVNSTELLCVTYGLIAGCGMSLPYFNSIVVVAVYFRKRRALATGIAECGAGVGTIIFAPLTDFLILNYGWRGAVFILGGVVANIIVCGALYRPLPASMRLEDASETKEPTAETECEREKDSANDQTTAELLENMSRANSYNNLLHHNHRKSQLQKISGNLQSHSLTDLESVSGLHVSHLSRGCLTISSSTINVKSPKSPEPCNTTKAITMSSFERARGWIFENVGDFSMFTYMPFLLFALSNFIMYFWYDVPYVFLVDKSVSMGITDFKSTFLVSIIGIVHTIGNIAYGFIADLEGVNKTVLYGVSIVLCGLSVLLVPCFESYIPLAILAGAFGLFSAANEALCSIILVDVVGLSRLNQAYGVIMMLQGVANLVGPPVAGLLCDISGYYSPTFFAAGACVMLAGVVYLVLPLIGRYKSRETTPEIVTEQMPSGDEATSAML